MSARARTRHLAADLLASGRAQRCEVVGCCARPDRLQVHHVMPREVALVSHSEHPGFIDAVDNLVWLCPDHHALVERFYWWELGKLQPVLCKGILLLAKAFDHHQVPAGELDGARAQSQYLREQLNRTAPWNALWWQAVYTRACRWAGHQQVLRAVHPSRALIEEPWFRDRRGLVSPESEYVVHG